MCLNIINWIYLLFQQLFAHENGVCCAYVRFFVCAMNPRHGYFRCKLIKILLDEKLLHFIFKYFANVFARSQYFHSKQSRDERSFRCAYLYWFESFMNYILSFLSYLTDAIFISFIKYVYLSIHLLRVYKCTSRIFNECFLLSIRNSILLSFIFSPINTDLHRFCLRFYYNEIDDGFLANKQIWFILNTCKANTRSIFSKFRLFSHTLNMIDKKIKLSWRLLIISLFFHFVRDDIELCLVFYFYIYSTK